MPNEHGALVSLLGAGVLAMLVVPRPLAALAPFALILLAFLARGPAERRARRFRPRRLDRAATIAYATAAIALVYAAADNNFAIAVAAAVCALAVLGVGAAAQVLRVHRSLGVELAGMAGCGIASGIAILGGGGHAELAAIAALTLAVYATSSVLLVRAQLRKNTAQRSVRQSRLALGVLAAGAAIACAYEPALGLAFVPRAAHVTVHCFVAARPTSPYKVAAIETGQLALFVALVALLAG